MFQCQGETRDPNHQVIWIAVKDLEKLRVVVFLLFHSV